MERLGREKVLIVLHSDGWVEAYAEDNVDVWIVNRPHVTTAKAGVLADEYLDLSLPHVYARLFWPGKIRKGWQLRKTTPVALKLQSWKMDFLRTLERVRKKFHVHELNFQLNAEADRNAENETQSVPMPREPNVDQPPVV